MGSGVVSTIRSGITNVKYFQDQPDVLAYGMLCAMFATAIWMLVATYWEVCAGCTVCICCAVLLHCMYLLGGLLQCSKCEH